MLPFRGGEVLANWLTKGRNMQPHSPMMLLSIAEEVSLRPDSAETFP